MIQIHESKSPGLTTSQPTVEEVINPNSRTGRYFVAKERIHTIFGAEVDGGEIIGIGRNETEALARLEQERAKFYESLWA